MRQYGRKLVIEYDEHEAIRNLLVGRSVAKVADDTLQLDNGLTLRVLPNEGCGGCPNGNYDLTELNDCVNAIMAVEFTDDAEGDKYAEDPHVYRIFVLAENTRIKLLEVSGDDGNGYYGTGYWIEVTLPGGK